MKYPLAIFDFDGTLADSLPRFLMIMNRLADEHGFRRIEESDIPQLRNADARRVLKHIGLPFWKLPWVSRQLLRMISSETSGISLFPGVEAGLRQLRTQGVRLGIVSSNSWGNICRILGPERVTLFDYAECEASIFGKRPKLRRVLRQAGVLPKQAIYIGDEVRDLQAAHAEGVYFGGVIWGHATRDTFLPHHPSAIFESVDEMLQWLTPTPPRHRPVIGADIPRTKDSP